jgi:NAD(P)-dependent dehydrogenase (short-subunit alcohol dehydrogenase family)
MKKGILITGALGGLGQVLVSAAEKLPEADCIIATDFRQEILDYYKENPRVLAMVMDVSSERSIRDVHEKLQHAEISIKYLINNAGIARFFPISEADESRLDSIIKVNTYGPVLTVSTFLLDLIENHGRVVQISSDNIRLSGLFQPYASSKIAMESLSVAMRQELGLRGVKLILFRPGAIKTGLLNDVEQICTLYEQSEYKAEFSKFMTIARKEVGKMIEPDVIARLVMKALKARNPQLVYSINKNAKISFLVKFPQRWIDYLVKRTIRSK